MNYYYDGYTNNIEGLAPQDVDRMENLYHPGIDMGWTGEPAGCAGGGEYLVRYGSSDGSSNASAPSPGGYYTYESPPGTIDPNLITTAYDHDHNYNYDYDYDMYSSSMSPQATSHTQASRSRHSSSTVIQCDFCSSTFRRRADLKRHIDHIHDSSNIILFHCDYPRCVRSSNPFKRKDHFRDHLRDYHKEDVEPKGKPVDEDWYAERNTARNWWRCQKCLNRVVIKNSEWKCPGCDGQAGERRKQARKRH